MPAETRVRRAKDNNAVANTGTKSRALAQSSADASSQAIPSRFNDACVTLRIRRRQRIALTTEQADNLFIVRSGIMLLTASLSQHRRVVMSVLCPGDVFRTSAAPRLADVALTAASAVEAGRIRWSAFEALLQEDAAVARYYHDRTNEMQARQLLHASCTGSLSGEERAASYLVEMGQRVGSFVGGSVSFDMAMTRNDIADYLALNADTLSRIMSRLKAKGITSQAGRGRTTIKSWADLLALTPVADVLRQIGASPSSSGELVGAHFGQPPKSL